MTEAPLAAPETGFDPADMKPVLLPPRGFRPASNLLYVQDCANPFTRRSKSSRVQRSGLAYERKVKEMLRRRFGDRANLGQWFKFFDGYRTRYCQPDAIVQEEEGILIVEIKLRFSDLAWWQLKELYLPVVRKYFRVPSCRLLCLCKSFDPNAAVCLPEIIPLIDNWNPRIPGCVYAQIWRG